MRVDDALFERCLVTHERHCYYCERFLKLDGPISAVGRIPWERAHALASLLPFWTRDRSMSSSAGSKAH
jgi:hypothetical protein